MRPAGAPNGRRTGPFLEYEATHLVAHRDQRTDPFPPQWGRPTQRASTPACGAWPDQRARGALCSSTPRAWWRSSSFQLRRVGLAGGSPSMTWAHEKIRTACSFARQRLLGEPERDCGPSPSSITRSMAAVVGDLPENPARRSPHSRASATAPTTWSSNHLFGDLCRKWVWSQMRLQSATRQARRRELAGADLGGYLPCFRAAASSPNDPVRRPALRFPAGNSAHHPGFVVVGGGLAAAGGQHAPPSNKPTSPYCEAESAPRALLVRQLPAEWRATEAMSALVRPTTGQQVRVGESKR